MVTNPLWAPFPVPRKTFIRMLSTPSVPGKVFASMPASHRARLLKRLDAFAFGEHALRALVSRLNAVGALRVVSLHLITMADRDQILLAINGNHGQVLASLDPKRFVVLVELNDVVLVGTNRQSFGPRA